MDIYAILPNQPTGCPFKYVTVQLLETRQIFPDCLSQTDQNEALLFLNLSSCKHACQSGVSNGIN